jgi:hypothetical protein
MKSLAPVGPKDVVYLKHWLTKEEYAALDENTRGHYIPIVMNISSRLIPERCAN